MNKLWNKFKEEIKDITLVPRLNLLDLLTFSTLVGLEHAGKFGFIGFCMFWLPWCWLSGHMQVKYQTRKAKEVKQ